MIVYGIRVGTYPESVVSHERRPTIFVSFNIFDHETKLDNVDINTHGINIDIHDNCQPLFA